MSRPTVSLSELTASVLAEAESAERIKVAEHQAVRAATPTTTGELSQLMHKVAEELRAAPAEVTFEDVRQFLRGEL